MIKEGFYNKKRSFHYKKVIGRDLFSEKHRGRIKQLEQSPNDVVKKF